MIKCVNCGGLLDRSLSQYLKSSSSTLDEAFEKGRQHAFAENMAREHDGYGSYLNSNIFYLTDNNLVCFGCVLKGVKKCAFCGDLFEDGVITDPLIDHIAEHYHRREDEGPNYWDMDFCTKPNCKVVGDFYSENAKYPGYTKDLYAARQAIFKYQYGTANMIFTAAILAYEAHKLKSCRH